MGLPFGCRRGGISGLLDLDRDVWEAIEYEAVRAGRSLRDLSWREIKVLVRHAEPGSAIYRATFGEQATWSVTDHLLAALVDLMNLLVWFKSKDGQRNQNRPKPVERPGTREEAPVELPVGDDGAVGSLEDDVTLKGVAMTPAEFNAWWNSN